MNGKEDTSEETSRIIADASSNIKKDRQRLIELIDKVRSNIDKMSALVPAVEDPDSDAEPAVTVGLHDFLESLTRATDSLTKSNAQLVELAKLSARQSRPREDGAPLDDNDKETLYDDMEKHGAN
jgi:hypothetical protein